MSEHPETLTLHLPEPTALRPLGSATTVLRNVLAGMRSGVAEVPCQGCTACCRAGYSVPLSPGEAARLPSVPDTDGFPILPRHPDGSCALLVEGRCSIYTQRPQSCKDYDCRVFSLVRVFPGRLLEQEDFRPFQVTLPTVEDRVRSGALALAVVGQVGQGKDPEDAARIAVLTHARFVPLARHLVDQVDTDPQRRRQIQAAVQQHLRKQAPRRMTRRQFIHRARRK